MNQLTKFIRHLLIVFFAIAITDVAAVSAPTDREKMAAYWGQIADLYAQALGDAVSSFGDPDRSDKANYLENCSTVARIGAARVDSIEIPNEWDDVKVKLRSGFTEFAARCNDAKVRIYTSDGTDRDKARKSLISAPADLRSALHLARLHYSGSGGRPSDLHLAGI